MVAIFVTIALLRILFVFVFLPLLVETAFSYSKEVFLIDSLFIIFSILFIYIYSKRFNKKISQEQQNTADIINRYEALSIATNDAIWDHDLTTAKTYYNDRLIQMFGYTKNDLENNETWWMDNIHPNDKESVAEKIKGKLNSTNNLWLDEYRFRCKNGDYKIVRDRSYIVRNAKNIPTRLIGAMNDITIEKELQEKLLEEKLDNKNKLGKAIIQTHEEERKKIRYELHEDVNQILAAIKMSIQQNTNKLDATDTVLQSVDYLNEVIKKIRKISNQLSPGAMEYFGLISSIEEIIIYNETNYAIKIWLDADDFNEGNIENSIRIFIYRIVQDLLAVLVEGSNNENLVITVKIENVLNKVQLIFKHKIDIDKNKLIKMRRFIDIKNKLEMYNGAMEISENNDGIETCTISL